MATSVIEPRRIRRANDAEPRADGDHVLYWMGRSQRAEHNPALELAIQRANALEKRLLVVAALPDGVTARHRAFELQGLAEVEQALSSRKIKLAVRRGSAEAVVGPFLDEAACAVFDDDVRRGPAEARSSLASRARCPVEQVEGDVVVPLRVASDKREYAARTLRPKLQEAWPGYLVELRTTAVDKDSRNLSVDRLDLSDIDEVLDSMDLDWSVPPTTRFEGGTRRARARFRRFVEQRLDDYDAHRNRPETDDVSAMSPYLRFGQISPVWLALHAGEGHARDVYLEELVVRRELAHNYCAFEPDYDRYEALPGWARETLAEHADDPRPHLYRREDLEAAETHDPSWNAAMREMRETGYLHNHMRMYWGKKVLEWSASPEEAYETLLHLNNRWFLDGGDPNSFANVGWVFGLHDRPFGERPVFGKVRSMSARGLERKGDPEAYVDKVDRMLSDEA